jgi:t-SNARE complex subunit (syntaxin)
MSNSTDDELIKIDDCIDTWSSRMASASDFQRLHNAISTNLTKISNNATDLEKLVHKLGTPEDSEPLRERYHRLQNETKHLMQQTNDALQELNNARVLTEADQRRKKTLTENLPKQYLATLNRFQEAQRIGARKEKESLDRARAISFRQQGISDSPFADNFVSTPTHDQLQQQAVLPIEQEVDMRSLRERDEQLRELETNIVEVNELFKDVAKLVHEQGGVIDSIDRHIIDTEVNIHQGNQQLTKATTYQVAFSFFSINKNFSLYFSFIYLLFSI